MLFIFGCTQPQVQVANTTPIIQEQVVNTTNTTIVVEEQTDFITYPKVFDGNLTAYFIDVGQGDSILLVTPDRKTMLIDGGSKSKGPIITSFIRNLGFSKLDYVVNTNPDADHIGGLIYTIQKLKPTLIIDNGLEKDTETYREYKTLLTNNTHKIIYYDSPFDFGEGILFSFIVPYDDGQGYSKEVNDNSVIIKVSYKDVTYLLMGDCSEECESRIEDSDLDADVLKVAHHGSCSSSTLFFLDGVTPKISVIQSGENNQYGHPCPDVLDRLKNSEIYRNDLDGNIMVTTDGYNIAALSTK